jgi:hypothetical protein
VTLNGRDLRRTRAACQIGGRVVRPLSTRACEPGWAHTSARRQVCHPRSPFAHALDRIARRRTSRPAGSSRDSISRSIAGRGFACRPRRPATAVVTLSRPRCTSDFVRAIGHGSMGFFRTRVHEMWRPSWGSAGSSRTGNARGRSQAARRNGGTAIKSPIDRSTWAMSEPSTSSSALTTVISLSQTIRRASSISSSSTSPRGRGDRRPRRRAKQTPIRSGCAVRCIRARRLPPAPR